MNPRVSPWFARAAALATLLALLSIPPARAQGGGARPPIPITPGNIGNIIGGAGGINIGQIIGGIVGGATSNIPVIIAAQGVLTGEPAQATVIIPSQVAAGGANGGRKVS